MICKCFAGDLKNSLKIGVFLQISRKKFFSKQSYWDVSYSDSTILPVFWKRLQNPESVTTPYNILANTY